MRYESWATAELPDSQLRSWASGIKLEPSVLESETFFPGTFLRWMIIPMANKYANKPVMILWYNLAPLTTTCMNKQAIKDHVRTRPCAPSTTRHASQVKPLASQRHRPQRNLQLSDVTYKLNQVVQTCWKNVEHMSKSFQSGHVASTDESDLEPESLPLHWFIFRPEDVYIQ